MPAKRPLARACDPCRRRRIKCDGDPSQCSYCRMSDLDCHYSSPRKRGPKSDHDTSKLSSGSQISVRESLNRSQTPDSSELQNFLPVQESAFVPTSYFKTSSPSSSIEIDNFLTDQHFSLDDCLRAFSIEIHQVAKSLGLAQSISNVANLYIDAFVSYIFPIAPLIHESSLRSSTYLLEADLTSPVELNYTDLKTANLIKLRQFALITAVCAVVGYMLPRRMCPADLSLSAAFLQASKKALALYHDSDIQDLKSSSIIIRYFHCNCIHAIGQTQKSWLIMGDAIRSALVMRLHDESTYINMPSVERQLCRNIFWQLYTADKSSALLNLRSFMLHDLCLTDKLSVHSPRPEESTLLSSRSPEDEMTIMIGFNMCQDIFHYASELCLEIKLTTRYGLSAPANVHEIALADLYLKFNTALDDMPLKLRDASIGQKDDLPSMFQIQAANLLVTKHCLRLLILQQCVQHRLHHILGLPHDESLLGLHRLEIARDFIQTIQDISFDALRVNGEPSNEKIRQVGACLLKMQHESRERLLSARASKDLEVLLDILSRLNSRASQALIKSREAIGRTATND